MEGPAGLAEEPRLFYVTLIRTWDQLHLCAPLRMHHHRMPANDRHGYGQLTASHPDCAGRVREPWTLPPLPRTRWCPGSGRSPATIDAALDLLFGLA